MLKPAFIDLSHHNTIPVSLKPTRDSGIMGVIHKATEGSSYIDDTLEARHWLTEDAGMLWGMYHFVRPGSMQDQVDHFLSKAEPYIDDKTLLALDWEDYGVSLEQAIEFMQALERATDRSPVLYSGHVVKELGGNSEELSRYRLWLAQYSSEPDLPPAWSQYWGWQYTDQGEVPGVNPDTDLNAYAGTRRELVNDWSGMSAESVPPRDYKTTVVMITAPADATITVETIDNGS